MRKLLIALLLINPVYAEVNPAPCVGIYCNVETPQEPDVINPMPPIINQFSCPEGFYQIAITCYPFKFSSHQEAEQHWYASAWGIKIWGDLIKQAIPDFQAIDLSALLQPVVPFECNGFEVWPDSNLCSKFLNQAEAEANYEASLLTNFQYWELLSQIRNTPAPTPPSQCKRFRGQNVYKARSETRPGAVIVMDRVRYCFDNPPTQTDMRPLQIFMNDMFGNRISSGSFRHCNRANGGRLHYDFPAGSGEAIIEILFEDDTTECFYVPERSRDQR